MQQPHFAENAHRFPAHVVVGPSGNGATTQVLDPRNKTATQPSRDETIGQLFEAQVRRTPDQIAVVLGGRRWTYRELNARANQLAHHLHTLGVGPDVLVGLCVERSLDMVVGLLGILKAGGAYVPLDPAFPRDRLAFYVADSQMPVLVTQRHLIDRLPVHSAQRLFLDSDWPTISRLSVDNPPATSTPENLVYVIYTSGSTGKPKGVQVVHRALTNFLHSMRREPGLTADDILLSVTTLSFDIHALEIWLPLTTGARVVVVSRDVATDGIRLLQQLTNSRATVMQATPATWRRLLVSGWQGSPQLKVLCGGEPLTVELAQQLLEKAGELWNMYGPTETTVWSTVYRVRSANHTIPIGAPIDNTYARLLDADGGTVPAGEPGELYLGGSCLARGYLNRPELTAERFVRDPLGCGEDRLYRTGDRARLLADGNLEFLGRVDHQVKVAGFRVELGEVESVLSQHPGVREAVVACRPGSGGSRLIAYLVIDPQRPPAVQDLRRFLGDRLPYYMVPAAFVYLDALPLTPSGKVDRAALPTPPESRPDLGQPVVRPRTDLEQQLAALWEEVLKVRPVGVTDTFGDLGGSSLQAADMLLHVRKRLGKDASLPALSRELTVERLAALLSPAENPAPWSALVPLRPQGSKAPLFFVHGIGGEVISFTPLIRCLSPDQPVYGIQVPAVEGVCKRFPSLEAMAAHYVAELLAIRPDGPFLLGGYSLGGVVAFEMARQLYARGRRAALVAVVDESAPGAGPAPWRIRTGWAFVGNLMPWFAEEFHRHTPLQFAARVGRKLWSVLRRVLWSVRGRRPDGPPVDISSWIDPRLPEDFRAFCEHNYRALLAYAPDAYPEAIAIFRARVQPLFGCHERDLGWSRLAAGGVTTEVFPGSHDTILREPSVRALADVLQAALDQAAAESGSTVLGSLPATV